MTRSLISEIDALHSGYVAAVNTAVAADDLPRAERLAAEYDVAAIRLMAEREGREDLVEEILQARYPAPDSRLRRLIAGLRLTRVA